MSGMRRSAAAAALHGLLLFGLAGAGHAHECTITAADIPAGGTVHLQTITADLLEMESVYNFVSVTQPNVVVMTPLTLVAHHGRFAFTAIGPVGAQTTLSIHWFYEPQDASGICAIAFTIVEAQTPASAANHEAGGEIVDDPVDSFSGELYMTEPPDLRLDGPLPLVFQRRYGSALVDDGLISGYLGTNWLHNYDMRLTATATRADVVTHWGRRLRFDRVGSSWQLVAPLDIPYQLVEDASGFVLMDPRNQHRHRFDSEGRPVQHLDRNGNSLTLGYTGTLLTSISDGLGRALTLAYDGNEHLSSVSDGTRTVSFGYSGNLLALVTDTRGNATTYAYASGAGARPGRMLSKTLPEGNVRYAQTFDASGRVAEQTDADANTVAIDYDGGVTTALVPGAATREHVHSAKAELLASTDEIGGARTFAYNSAGQRTLIEDALGGQTAYTYHAPSGRVASVTHADASVVGFVYAASVADGFTYHDLVRIDHPDGTQDRFVRDAAGNITRHTDRASQQWNFTYNARGQPLTVSNPLGGLTRFAYRADAMPATATDPAGNVTAFGYDAAYRLNQITHPDGSTRIYTFDAAGNPVGIQDETGQSWQLDFDANHNFMRLTDPFGNFAELGFDAMDRVASQTDRLGEQWTLDYDERERLGAVTGPDAGTIAFNYDARGQLIQVTDAAAHAWQRQADAEGITAAATNPGAATAWMLADAMGRTTRVTAPSGAQTDVTYDSQGRITGIVNAELEATTISYGGLGLPSAAAQGNGTAAASYQRNGLGQLTTLVDPNGRSWRRGYDPQGRLVSMTDPLGFATTFGHDNRNRIASIDYPSTLGSAALEYDGMDRPVRRTFSDGLLLEFEYDAHGRLTSATGVQLGYDHEGRITTSNGIELAYDGVGRMAMLRFAPGRQVDYAYDSRGLLASISGMGGTTTFAYDANGRRVSVTRPNGVTTTYGYDVDDRVIAIQHGASSILLARDAVGRIVQAQRQLPAPSDFESIEAFAADYDAASQVSAWTYDARGRLLDDGRRTYTWDPADRLTAVTRAGQTVQFTYDALGRRLSRSESGTVRSHVWNYAVPGGFPSIERSNGVDQRYYVTDADGMLLYSTDAAGNNRLDYHFDEAGNTAFLTDAVGSIVHSYAYSPFGPLPGSPDLLGNPFTWGGEYGQLQDHADGLFYLRDRWYDAHSSRFLSRDTIQSTEPRAINPYQYALGDPLRFHDASGRNARVNQSGVHTDISVDVWEGDSIVGVLTVSFEAKGRDLCDVLNGQGVFVVDYKDSGGIGQPGSGGGTVVVGSKAQDQALASWLLDAVGNQRTWDINVHDTRILDGIARLSRHETVRKHGRIRSFSGVKVESAGCWETYRLASQCCNDFTDAALDIYFGSNWYWGPLFTGEGLVQELREHLGQD